jgi:hypothetical protein
LTLVYEVISYVIHKRNLLDKKEREIAITDEISQIDTASHATLYALEETPRSYSPFNANGVSAKNTIYNNASHQNMKTYVKQNVTPKPKAQCLQFTSVSPINSKMNKFTCMI